MTDKLVEILYIGTPTGGKSFVAEMMRQNIELHKVYDEAHIVDKPDMCWAEEVAKLQWARKGLEHAATYGVSVGTVGKRKAQWKQERGFYKRKDGK